MGTVIKFPNSKKTPPVKVSAANQNIPHETRQEAIRKKYASSVNKGWKVNSGSKAYGVSKTPTTAGSIMRQTAGTLARGALRYGTGPVGALIGMTVPVGEGSDKPSGPLMKGNADRGPQRPRYKPQSGPKSRKSSSKVKLTNNKKKK
jgi:hypothetical protein